MNEQAFFKECLSVPHPPIELQAKILLAIQRSTMRRIWVEFLSALTASFGLVGYLALSRAHLQEELQTSSFFSFVRLAISDPDIVFANFTESFFGIVESIPFEAVLLCLVLGLFLTCTVGFFLRLREVHAHFVPRLML
jgi:drug/metabolite transporter (DMT)-like permease